MANWSRQEGTPFPLGAVWMEAEQAYNFALFSRYASAVTLCLYTAEDLVTPVLSVALDYRLNKSGRVWHCRVSKAKIPAAQFYAYQIDGPAPNGQFEWHAFDKDKILLDPYAKSVFFPPGFDIGAAVSSVPGSNAGKAMLGRLPSSPPVFDWGSAARPFHEGDLVIYEMHVKGFTANPDSGVARPGTYAGLVEKIPYLVDLGITAVELMPIYQFDPTDGDYWGYSPLNFFTPHSVYAGPGGADPRDEFRRLVKALHDAGIEVILDVVYNHTGEGNQDGPTLSFKGIDNASYYLMTGNPSDPYANYSGTGNTLDCASPPVRQLTVDSLRYWAREFHVDGFRFDLASVFSRDADGSVNTDDPPILDQIAADPVLRGLRFIAEPWDASGDGYELGTRFPGLLWLQWNGKFRDDLQHFVKSDNGYVGALMTRLYGSADIFPDTLSCAYRPYQSVNFITSHDGFTLYDLVSYNQKHNEANGQGNTDGPDDASWNCGWEGDSGVPAEVLALRKRQVKNFCCLLFLANGTPMFRAGDEFMQTQGGDNNPYNQDNLTSWLDWARLAQNADLFRFFKMMIAFRKAHPSLCRAQFWGGDISWYGVGHACDLSDASHALAWRLHGASQGDKDIYVMINAYWEDLTFTVQEGQAADWKLAIDTAAASPKDISDESARVALGAMTYGVTARSVVVLVHS